MPVLVCASLMTAICIVTLLYRINQQLFFVMTRMFPEGEQTGPFQGGDLVKEGTFVSCIELPSLRH